jgi:uncharacterized protein YcfJ
MANKLWIVGLTTAALVVPQLASARSSCEARAHHGKVVGTVAGAAGGAVIGGLLGHGTGALIGAAGGAVVGNQLARTKCYHYRHSASYYRHHRRPHHYADYAPYGYYGPEGSYHPYG